MGVIQSAINQMLGTAGIATRLSPELETRAQIRAIEKEESKLRETTKQLSEEVTDVNKRLQAEAALNLPEKRIENVKKQQELGLRTPGNAAAIIQNEQRGMQISQAIANKKAMIKPFSAQQLLKERQQQANQQAMAYTEAKRTQIMNFRKSILLNAQGQNLMLPVDMRGKK